MTRRARAEMIEQTRARLIAVGRKAFAQKGYSNASMDDFTAEAGLTRGALYHHFDGKKGLFEAVVEQLDAEMAARLTEAATKAATPWQAFVDENIAYLEMAMEPEIQRIILRDGPAVLGDPSRWSSAEACVATIRASLEQLQADGVIEPVDSEATARLISGASTSAAQWIANADDPHAISNRAILAFRTLLERLRRGAPASA
jgi:AcrR family transcriptional regulator